MLSNPAVSGEPEDQLRSPLEGLIADLARLCGFATHSVIPVGESSLSDLKTRPDYAVTVHNRTPGAQAGSTSGARPGQDGKSSFRIIVTKPTSHR